MGSRAGAIKSFASPNHLLRSFPQAEIMFQNKLGCCCLKHEDGDVSSVCKLTYCAYTDVMTMAMQGSSALDLLEAIQAQGDRRRHALKS